MQTGLNIYFSDFFGVDEDIIESYGAVNISLINDMPLFVDPFLLFNSEKEEYQRIHNNHHPVFTFFTGTSRKISHPAPGNAYHMVSLF